MEFKRNRSLDLVCFGRVGADLNPDTFNVPMEKVSSYTISVGGSPANIAVGAAKLGMRVGFIGKVSNDAMGRYVVTHLKKHNIDTSNITQEADGVTSLAVTEVLSPDECPVVFYRDNVTDLKISCRDISEQYIANTKALLISGTALAKSPSREAVFLAVEYAKKHQTIIALDLDYRPYSWTSPEETSIYYQLLCEKCDIIIGTRKEFDSVEYLLFPDNQDDQLTAQNWLKKSANLVLIKHGQHGSKAFDKAGRCYVGQPYPTKVRKTFGAGDAFAACFLSRLITGDPIETAIQYAAISASIVISKTDCTEAMPTQAEIQQFKNRMGSNFPAE